MSTTNQSVVDLPVRVAHQIRDQFTVIDVREPHELPSGVIDAAYNAPLAEVLASGLPGIPANTPLLVVCRSGGRSLRAATTLAGRGYTAVHNLSGGMMAWLETGLPVGRATTVLAVAM